MTSSIWAVIILLVKIKPEPQSGWKEGGFQLLCLQLDIKPKKNIAVLILWMMQAWLSGSSHAVLRACSPCATHNPLVTTHNPLSVSSLTALRQLEEHSVKCPSLTETGNASDGG